MKQQKRNILRWARGNQNKTITKKTRYDYNLTIMKSPKPATDNRFK